MEKQAKNTRPPIVAILGHVDHGKTTLLDKIRSSNIAAREAGGITQSIGAWQVDTKEGKKITFIDTPGHEAFQAMRARGAKVADIAVLVVAADDGVMPQTKESIKHIKDAKIPFLVAITKVDLPTAQPEKVKNQLLKEEVLLEGHGGDTVSVEVSGKTGEGLDELLEMILLLAEMAQVEGSVNAPLVAPIIEAKLDRRRGIVVHAIVREGALRVGSEIEAEGFLAKIRGLFDEMGEPLKEALPGMPVEILGFSKLPPVGAVIKEFDEKKEKRGVPEERKKQVTEISGLSILLKTDTVGSLEAIENQLHEKVSVVFSAVGDITESDVRRALTAGAAIIGFSVRLPKEVAKIAEEEGIRIHIYKVIYEIFQDIEKWIREKKEEAEEKILGRAEILREFPHGKEKIAGCRVLSGKISSTARLRLVRNNEVLGQTRPASIKKNKERVDKVLEGEEFGIVFAPPIDFKVGDVIESWQLPKP